MKKLLLATATAAVMATAYPTPSNATCFITGTITDVFEYHDGVSTVQNFFLKTGTLANHQYFFELSDDSLTGFAATAATSQAQVQVRSDAVSCPTTGSTRDSGNAEYIWFH